MGEGDLKELQQLVEFLKASGVAEFDMERPELKVRLTFAPAASALAPAAAAQVDLTQLARLMASAGSAPAVVAAEVAQAHVAMADASAIAASPTGLGVSAEESSTDDEVGLHMVKSPLVGTFYDAPSPGADSFVKLGDTVSVGKVLCIVEAMKIMNEIESDASGEVVKVYVRPGQPVEYGQRLFAVKP